MAQKVQNKINNMRGHIMKTGFVYMWTSKSTSKKYIGSHYGEFNDNYISSSKFFDEIYNENPDDFTRTILISGLTRDQALVEEEKRLVQVDAANNIEYYNLHNHPGRGWSHHDNPELAKIYYDRISKARKGQIAWNKGKKIWTDKNRHKLKIDEWLVRLPSGNEIVIKNMLEFCKINNLNPSAMSSVARGNRQHYKNYWCKKLTNNRNVNYEQKEWQSKGHASKARYGADNGFSKKVEINGIVYDCMKDAVEETKLSMYLIRKRGNFNV